MQDVGLFFSGKAHFSDSCHTSAIQLTIVILTQNTLNGQQPSIGHVNDKNI